MCQWCPTSDINCDPAAIMIVVVKHWETFLFTSQELLPEELFTVTNSSFMRS